MENQIQLQLRQHMENQIQLQLHHFCINNYNYVIGPMSDYDAGVRLISVTLIKVKTNGFFL